MDNRIIALMGALLGGAVWIVILSLLLPAGQEGIAADLLLDRNTESFVYPFTIQNLMWMVFFIGIGELVIRHLSGRLETEQLGRRLLPEDEQTVLQKKDIGPLYSKVRRSDPEGRYWLQRLLGRTMLQFQSTESIEQSNSLFNSTLELYQHEIDLRYNMLRYLVWLIPTLGFIGTVVGIALALKGAGAAFVSGADIAELGPNLMAKMTRELGVAFFTTLLALLQSAVLMFALHIVQGREEWALNRIGQYCLDNLINRLYVSK